MARGLRITKRKFVCVEQAVGLNGIMSNALSALMTNTEALRITSNNIANLNTPGYRAPHHPGRHVRDRRHAERRGYRNCPARDRYISEPRGDHGRRHLRALRRTNLRVQPARWNTRLPRRQHRTHLAAQQCLRRARPGDAGAGRFLQPAWRAQRLSKPRHADGLALELDFRPSHAGRPADQRRHRAGQHTAQADQRPERTSAAGHDQRRYRIGGLRPARSGDRKPFTTDRHPHAGSG